MPFDYSLDFKNLDFREDPYLYRVGKGEQGVLMVEPYKSELLPCWRFRTPDLARQSSWALYQKFLAYKKDSDFVGMDMARKFIQMGFTRARRYANHHSGRKYQNGEVLPFAPDEVKAENARIFKAVWDRVERDKRYLQMRTEWKLWYD